MRIKQFIKRAVSLIAAGALLVSNVSGFTAFAEETQPTIYAESVEAQPGETVDVKIHVKNNPGFVTVQLAAKYNSVNLTLTGKNLNAAGLIDNGAPVNQAKDIDSETKEYTIDFGNDTAPSDYTADGLLYTLSFKVSENAPVGKYPVTLTYGDAYNFDLDKVTFASQSAIIHVVCKHADLQTVAAKAETCTADGNIAYWYCPTCKKYFNDADANIEITREETLTKAHHALAQIPAKEPTCENEGNIAYYACSVCGKLFKDANAATEMTADAVKVAKLSHKLTKTASKPATCEDEGNNEYYTCSACGKVFKDADGKTVTTVEEEKIAVTGHTMTRTDAKAATCTEDGNTEYYTCSVCGKIFKDENATTEISLDDTVVKAHHTMTKTDAKEPTCTAEGSNAYYTCSVCGKVFKDEAGTQPTTVEEETLAKKAHTPVVDAAVAATCAKTGLTEGSHCSVCNEVLVAQKVVDKIPHTIVVDAAVEPTYSSSGLTEGKHCSVCHEIIEKQTYIPAKSESNVTVIGGESFAGSKKDLADAVLSAEDIENINNGKDVTIRLNVALKSDATDAIKEQVKAKLKDYTIGTFYDIDISKSVDGGAPVAVTDTNAPVHIQLTLADSLINTDTTVKREYKIVRFHYDSVSGQTVVDVLDASYHAGYNKLAFNTDKFSVYSVVYKDTKMAPAPAVTPGSSSGNSGNASAEASSVTGKVCPICGYNNCKLGNDNRWHCGKCAHSWQEYGQTGSTPAANSAPKSPKTGLF